MLMVGMQVNQTSVFLLKFLGKFVQGIVIGTWETGSWIGLKKEENISYSWLATGPIR